MARALIVKLGAIGDVVMAIPAARALHDAGYEVDWMCGETVAPVLGLFPWIGTIVVDEAKLLRGGAGARGRAMLGVWRQLAGRGVGQSYDLCATLYYDRRYRLLTLPARARRRLLLSVKDRRRQLIPGRHHTDEYVRILLGLRDDEAPRQVSPVRAEGLPSNPVVRVEKKARVVLVPGGARNLLRDDALRRWPLANYVELARRLVERGCEVVLAGGPEDGWVRAGFAGVPVNDCVGTLSLVETVALLDSAEVTVTHDTGPLHLAGLTRSAPVGIFGPTDPRGRLPNVPNAVVLWGGEGFACRPCYDGRDYAPCHHNGCMEQVTVEMALAEVERLLEVVAEGRELPPRVVTPEHTPLLPAGELVRVRLRAEGKKLP